MSVYSQLDPPTDNGVVLGGGDMTQQQFLPQCDVNVIMESYVKEGGWTEEAVVHQRMTTFWDCSTVEDKYEDYLATVTAVRTEFDRLPGSIRARFEDNPQLLLEWLDDPNNKTEAVELGIVHEDYLGFQA